MDQNIVSILVAIIGLAGILATALIAYRQGKLKVEQDLQVEYDKDLRARRITYYMKLLRHMRPLAKYPEPERLTYDHLRQLSISLTRWYYAGGGLILSTETRDEYFNFQDGIKIILQKQTNKWELDNKALTISTLQQYLGRAVDWKCPPILMVVAKVEIDTANQSVPESLWDMLFKLASSLRTSLTDDVLTRQSPILRKSSSQS